MNNVSNVKQSTHSQTDLDVLVQACRNVTDAGAMRVWWWDMKEWREAMFMLIRAEYRRLLNLKKSKKRWRA